MKTVFFLILTIFFRNSLFSQNHILTYSNTANIGDKYEYFNVDSNGVFVTLGGQNLTWNYTVTIPTPTINTEYYIAPFTTGAGPIYFQNSNLSSCNCNQSTQPVNYKYYLKNTDSLTIIGEYNASVIYHYNKTIFKFPFTYGNNLSETYSHPDITGSFIINGKNIIEADATGSLTLNGNIFTNTLRLKNIVVEEKQGSNLKDSSISYSFYHSASKFPVLEIIYRYTIYNNTPYLSKYIRANKLVYNDLSEIYKNSLKIYPNPVLNNKIIIEFETKSTTNRNLSVNLINSLGESKTIPFYILEGNRIEVSLLEFPKGLYTLQINCNSQIINSKIINK